MAGRFSEDLEAFLDTALIAGCSCRRRRCHWHCAFGHLGTDAIGMILPLPSTVARVKSGAKMLRSAVQTAPIPTPHILAVLLDTVVAAEARSHQIQGSVFGARAARDGAGHSGVGTLSRGVSWGKAGLAGGRLLDCWRLVGGVLGMPRDAYIIAPGSLFRRSCWPLWDRGHHEHRVLRRRYSRVGCRNRYRHRRPGCGARGVWSSWPQFTCCCPLSAHRYPSRR